MTRKHFDAIAKVINEQLDEITASILISTASKQIAMITLRTTASLLAIEFKKQNANFDSSRFLTACGF